METVLDGYPLLKSNRARERYLKVLSEIREADGFDQAVAAFRTQFNGDGNIPCMTKDLFDVTGWETTASSKFLSKVRTGNFQTSHFMQRLIDIGCFTVGKTHLNEFAYGLSGENAHYGDCKHPHKAAAESGVLSGGSSSGSAWAVAKGLVPLATGTDTGGSIRVPASFCGIWGVRYVAGLWTEGCFPLAPSFDSVGYFCKTREDLKWIHNRLFKGWTESRGETSEKLALIDKAWFTDSRAYDLISSELAHRSISVSSNLTAELNDWLKLLPKAFSVLQSREAYRVHETWLESYKESYDPQTLGRIVRAKNWSEDDITDALSVRKSFLKWLGEIMEEHPCLVLPAAPGFAPIGHELDEEFRTALLQLTTPASMSGRPVVVEPLVLDGSWESIGLQYVYRDMRLLFS